ncbi:sigma-70 family RNA polymerase sigma factor [Brevundimonas vitis]|uniref:RNA polymerase sigma factor n=1 Tax=Brevundimonas vitisensis TaxID=2800818 RepID=A0ABX7BTL4_9CAUL|nr:sigma-70 family RNA polymerase sigma factor [Brevundimonas vitisensis]QQQ19439.1 sigma-70 family RNA polymerase sigma factor [Brevundimonas vitisensis]
MTAILTRDELAQALGRTGQGDRAAFRAVYESTSAKLMGVCLRILSDRQLAEDVLQDTYLTVWRKAETFDASRASPITWLVTIARNRSIDRLRSGAPMRTAAPIEAAIDLADAGPLPSAVTEQGDDVRRLNGCLEQLDEKVARCIRTAFFEGVTYDVLAEREGAPLGTMKSWIRRGLQRLKACLDQ